MGNKCIVISDKEPYLIPTAVLQDHITTTLQGAGTSKNKPTGRPSASILPEYAGKMRINKDMSSKMKHQSEADLSLPPTAVLQEHVNVDQAPIDSNILLEYAPFPDKEYTALCSHVLPSYTSAVTDQILSTLYCPQVQASLHQMKSWTGQYSIGG